MRANLPPDWAVLNNHEKLCVLLHEKGADPEVPDKFGERPVELSPAKLRKLFQSRAPPLIYKLLGASCR